ncbi:mitochondrial Rho GTPase isoform X2 [Hetaerina americana]|uniref:mitochondrial Rho GTPase isoform X2 n=1 Tax=Hetaerina americana TaxID=62018 RepID=UPI003A7F51A0
MVFHRRDASADSGSSPRGDGRGSQRKREGVRILLVGERGVGKTSLILSLVAEEFPEDEDEGEEGEGDEGIRIGNVLPAKAEEITIPADVTPENVPTHIVDYSAVEQNEEMLCAELRRAHVVCVVYAANDSESLQKVTTRWLPMIRRCCDPMWPEPCPCWPLDEEDIEVDVEGDLDGGEVILQPHPPPHLPPPPVILVGNKVDLVDEPSIDMVLSIMEQYPEIESCIECSAKTLKNISEMFYYAQKAVLHPTAPLYLIDEQDLTEKCKEALIRIFKICDADCDGLLSDEELDGFQRLCFQAPLQPHVLRNLKLLLASSSPDGIQNDCVTLPGFLFLHCLFIQRGRNETTWTVLRKFGYDDSLDVSLDYLRPNFRVESGCSTELSPVGQDFLTRLFEGADRDHDGALSPSELEVLLSPVPPFSTCCPFQRPGVDGHCPAIRALSPTTPLGWPTLNGYLCRWSLLTLVDIGSALECLAYLGYNTTSPDDSQLSAIQVTRDKKIDLAKKQTNRNVFKCHVIGPKGCGKSTFCRSFLPYPPPIASSHLDSSVGDLPLQYQFVVNTVQVYGQEKYLVLEEITLDSPNVALLPSQVNCDVACLVYDSSNSQSFQSIARIYLKYYAEAPIPVLIVGSHAESCGNCLNDAVRQEYLVQPAQFCSDNRLPPLQPFSLPVYPPKSNEKLLHPNPLGSGASKDVFVKLGTMAAFPRFQAAWVLFYKHRHLKQLGIFPGDQQCWWKAGLCIAAATAVGFLLAKVFKSDSRR